MQSEEKTHQCPDSCGTIIDASIAATTDIKKDPQPVVVICIGCKFYYNDRRKAKPLCIHPSSTKEKFSVVSGKIIISYDLCEASRGDLGVCTPDGVLFETRQPKQKIWDILLDAFSDTRVHYGC